MLKFGYLKEVFGIFCTAIFSNKVCLLLGEQKTTLISLTNAHLRRYQREGDEFLRCIVTGDETWAYSYEPQLKRRSSEWQCPGSPTPQKAGCVMSRQCTLFFLHCLLHDGPSPHRNACDAAPK